MITVLVLMKRRMSEVVGGSSNGMGGDIYGEGSESGSRGLIVVVLGVMMKTVYARIVEGSLWEGGNSCGGGY